MGKTWTKKKEQRWSCYFSVVTIYPKGHVLLPLDRIHVSWDIAGSSLKLLHLFSMNSKARAIETRGSESETQAA